MKITLAGVPGSGKSTIRKELADKYNLTTKGTGDFMRQICAKYGYTDITKFLVEYISNHPEVDLEIDEEQRKFGETHDNFVLDAHIGFHFVPDSIKVFLECNPEVAAQRIFDAKRKTEDAQSIQETIEANKKRAETMRANFMKLYQVDIHDEKNYDCIVDTTNLTPSEVFQQVVQHIDAHHET